MALDPMAQLFNPDLMAQYRALLEPPQEAKRAAGMDALLALGLGPARQPIAAPWRCGGQCRRRSDGGV